MKKTILLMCALAGCAGAQAKPRTLTLEETMHASDPDAKAMTKRWLEGPKFTYAVVEVEVIKE